MKVTPIKPRDPTIAPAQHARQARSGLARRRSKKENPPRSPHDFLDKRVAPSLKLVVGFEPQLDRLANIRAGLVQSIALGDAPRQRRHMGRVTAVFGWLEDNLQPH